MHFQSFLAVKFTTQLDHAENSRKFEVVIWKDVREGLGKEGEY